MSGVRGALCLRDERASRSRVAPRPLGTRTGEPRPRANGALLPHASSTHPDGRPGLAQCAKRESDGGVTRDASVSSAAGAPRAGTRALALRRKRARGARRRLPAGSSGCRSDQRPASGEERVQPARSGRHPLSQFDATLDPRRRRCFVRSGGEVSSGLDGRRLALLWGVAAVGWVVASCVRAAGWLGSGRRACRVAPG